MFTAVLLQSKAIEGRFYISHRYGAQEINSDNLGQVIKDMDPKIKYPLVMMPAPHGMFKPSELMDEWKLFNLHLYFAKTSYNNSDNTIQMPNPKTRTSTHSVYEDWHDMERCAVNFVRALCKVQRSTAGSKFQVPSNQILVLPFSITATDNVSGVKLSLDFRLWMGCTLEDYEEYPTTINIPDDTHPEHKM